MPHCVVEYSASLARSIDIAELVRGTHQGAIVSQLFDPMAVKTRSHPCEHFLVGTDPDDQFIHISVAIMPGRTDEQKALLLNCIAQQLEPFTPEVQSVTIEVRDINKQHYYKQTRVR